MTIQHKLATAQKRRDEMPNQMLARDISERKDTAAIGELIKLLQGKDKDYRHDSIKVLYEVGALNADLITPHFEILLSTLSSKDNRLQWGAMTAIYHLTPTNPALVYEALPTLLEAAKKGSVITKDNAMKALIALAVTDSYRNDMQPLLLEQLKMALPNQLPMYAELALTVVSNSEKETFAHILQLRLSDLKKASAQKRLQKVIQKLRS